jgi:hypothetical protein
MGVERVVVGKVLNYITIDRGALTGSVYDRYSYENEKREALQKWAEELSTILRLSPDAVPEIGRAEIHASNL